MIVEPRNRILQSTIDLISTKQDVEKVTIREIAQAAGVGVGLINYHFQSKDKLVRECVQIIVGNVIDRFPELASSIHLPPIEKLKYLLKSTSRFLVANPGISRVSILSDIIEPSVHNNSSQTLRAYLPVFTEALSPTRSAKEISVLAQVVLGSVQLAFLHSTGPNPGVTGLNFFDEEQRHKFIDVLIDSLLR